MSQTIPMLSDPYRNERAARGGTAKSPHSAPAIRAGVVAANTIAFALCFAVWVMFGPSVRTICAELRISPTLANLIKAIPILIGSTCRIPVGILTDRLGARLMFPLIMLIGAGATLALSFAATLTAIIIGGLVVGLVGTTFIVGAQSTSSWTAKEKQGFALGIFGAGNVGTAITTFGMPLLLVAVGWRTALQTYAGVLVIAAIAYWLVMRNAPRKGAAPTLAGLLAPLKDLRAWKFGLYYMATFGVFVAATLTLSDIYIDGYGLAATTAGLLATTFTFTASLSRIPGGWLADRLGPGIVTRTSLVVTAIGLALVIVGLPLWATVLSVFVAAVAMGIGMAGTFKYIPEHYPTNVGAVGGIVGALGGVGGFFLPLLSGVIKTAAGSVYLQVAPLAALAAVALGVLVLSERRSRQVTMPIFAGTNGGWPAIALPVDESIDDIEAEELGEEEELVATAQ
ncbi:MAG TPA: MFS transporter [Pirellulales bacterium]|jgi:NNP family nitrate/nitrite transporter-like MFS transporter|nr:MFS transporter [Pirellulales bacterium]